LEYSDLLIIYFRVILDFADFTMKMGFDLVNVINEKIISLKTHIETPKKDSKPKGPNDEDKNSAENGNRGRVQLPASENCLSDLFESAFKCEEKLQKLIDILCDQAIAPRIDKKIPAPCQSVRVVFP